MDMERLDFGWHRESGLNVCQGLEGTDHEARAHEQYKSQTDLDDDKRVTRPMPLAAGADRAGRIAKSSGNANTGIPKRRHRAEQETCHNRDAYGEEQDEPIDADVIEPGQIARRQSDHDPQGTISKEQAERAADHRQNEAFKQQTAGDASGATAQRRPNSQLLLSPFNSDQKKAGHVCAGDQQHQAYAPHQNPQNPAYVAYDVLLQRLYIRPYPRFFEELGRLGKTLEFPWDHASHVCIGFGRRRPRLEPGNRKVVIASQELRPERQQY